jgi:hypothetical protein
MNAVVKDDVLPNTQVLAVQQNVQFAATSISEIIDAKGIESISGDVLRYADIAAQAAEQADRAVISSQETMNAGADLVKLISQTIKKCDEDRKARTGKIDAFKRFVDGLFNASATKLDAAKSKINGKMNIWAAEQDRIKRELAREEARKQEEQALAMAATQQAIGDDKGADKILDDASRIVRKTEESAKVTATGSLGATSSKRTTISGVVNDYKAFVEALIAEGADLTQYIEFRKSAVNARAKVAHEAGATVPGLHIQKDESWVTR